MKHLVYVHQLIALKKIPNHHSEHSSNEFEANICKLFTTGSAVLGSHAHISIFLEQKLHKTEYLV
jgi:hypothetical protein